MSNEAYDDDEMLPEYDLTGGVRGKHYDRFKNGYSTRIVHEDGHVEQHYFTFEDGAVLLDPDLRKAFPDSESVNRALRSYLATH